MEMVGRGSKDEIGRETQDIAFQIVFSFHTGICGIRVVIIDILCRKCPQLINGKHREYGIAEKWKFQNELHEERNLSSNRVLNMIAYIYWLSACGRSRLKELYPLCDLGMS